MQSLAVKLLIRFFAMLPLRLNHAFGHLIGLALYFSRSKSYQVSLINICTCFPELDPAEHRRLAKQSLLEMGKSITEIGPMWLWPPRRTLSLLTEISGREHISAARARGKGVILLTPHLGCWEIAGLFLGAELPVTILYSPPKMQALEDLMRDARERSGAEVVATDARGIKAIFKALKQGSGTGILPDQNPDDMHNAVYAPFFNIPVATMSLIARLASKTGAGVVIGYARRLPRGQGYHLIIEPADKAVGDPDPQLATTALNQAIEKLIRRDPEQYQWSYKRFKRLPEGYPRLY